MHFIGAKDAGGGSDNWSYKTHKSNGHHQQTNVQIFTRQIPILSPNQRSQPVMALKEFPAKMLLHRNLRQVFRILFPSHLNKDLGPKPKAKDLIPKAKTKDLAPKVKDFMPKAKAKT